MQKGNILVLGITGQIGSELWKRLSGLENVFGTIRHAKNTDSHVLHLDVANFDQLSQVIDDVQPSLVINCTAYTAVDAAESDGVNNERINKEFPAELARLAHRHDFTLVHISTDYVYDGQGETPWLETDRCHPINAYGAAKFAGEECIRQSGCAAVILRTSWIYASHGKNFFLTMLRLGQERTELKVVDDQIGSPTSAAYVAMVIQSIVSEHNRDANDFRLNKLGTYHLACQGYTSWYEFARQIFTLCKTCGINMKIEHLLPIKSHEYPMVANRPFNSRLNCGKLQSRFKIEPMPWQEALQETFTQWRCKTE